MSMFTCQGCEFTAEELKDAMAHVSDNMSHAMTKPVDDEGSLMTVSAAWDEDIVDDDEDDWGWDE